MHPSRLVILGDPVEHSLSPRFQGAAIRAAGLTISYDALRVGKQDLPRVASELLAANTGGNITAPHKIAFLPLCSEVSAVAVRVGAVNTFWVDEGKLCADNTDVGGFDAAARQALGEIPEGLKVGLIGAGGAAAAVIGAIQDWPGAKVSVYSRTAARAQALAQRFGDSVSVESTLRGALLEVDLVVNATPIGMNDDALPFAISDLPRGAVVMDLVYRKGGTALTRGAVQAGFRALDGTAMLVEQGALSFERWFGFAPDKTVMLASLK